ncbi:MULTISPECIES: GNAT family N-acetyltransferase [unclassified Rhizobium]|jgi:GNAT superfamily N-acetyltransferase|uniref:GNAT family N-acetyltransferase n=1 Tax=unclassified Rhizobium TaxID=2613769 RepID=UPI001ADAE9D0|nr:MULTISPECIES: GNAT family N-acetyltransferase [unclassified Rhizobium]MBO9127467.1 GNAT family N-acetyltransferase [Rhizobium sp. 16-488-2b]MBO9177910.1 GNAT family N-acetyltransferase [Rhizobium sp. 16-488-2a]MBO9197703.1 GNAT family N-acetyltransferase [Rhizobium sp. 16-449-1b]
MDMLVKLYELKRDPALDSRMTSQGVTIRRVLVPELPALTSWIEPRFGAGWAAEATAAAMRQPTTCFIAIQAGELIGFACHEATAKGFFGPTGVDQAARGKGVGHALLLETLLDMHAQGYPYGVIGGAGPMDFYRKSVGAIPIEGSDPGIYRGMLSLAHPSEISS